MYSSSLNYDKHTYYSVKMFYQQLTFLFLKGSQVCWIHIRKCFKLYNDTSTFWKSKLAVFIENNFFGIRSKWSSNWNVIVQMNTSCIISWWALIKLIKKEINIEAMAFLFNYIMSLCSEFQQRLFGCSVELIMKYDIVIHYRKLLFITFSNDQPKFNSKE